MSAAGPRLFWWSASGAMVLHAWLLFSVDGLQGGADLRPHLRLIQLMGEEPALRSVYAPAYHALGALLAPVLGLGAFPKWFALASAAALIAGFRAFQRAAALPEAAAAIFALSPYTFALSWCLPKVEAMGYALAFAALATLLRGRYVSTALLLAATFWVHTAAALFLGLCGGVLALSRGDRRGLAALATGSLGAAPLVASHIAAGCSAAQALLFSTGDYLRAAPPRRAAGAWADLAALAGPVALIAAALGARELWSRNRSVAVLCGVALALYLNELWLAPFGTGSTLDLLRGLTVLALPTAAAAGVFALSHPRLAPALVATCAAWALLAALFVVPGSCFVRPIDPDQVADLSVDRCTFRWRRP